MPLREAFKHKPKGDPRRQQQYHDLVTAIARGNEMEGWAGLAFAEAMSMYWREQFIDHYKVKLARLTRYCPHWILNKRPRDCYGPVCRCFGELGFDHVELWLRDRKPFLMTSQPYHLTGENMVAMGRLKTEYGCSVWVDAASFYYPARTIMVTVGGAAYKRWVAMKDGKVTDIRNHPRNPINGR